MIAVTIGKNQLPRRVAISDGATGIIVVAQTLLFLFSICLCATHGLWQRHARMLMTPGDDIITGATAVHLYEPRTSISLVVSIPRALLSVFLGPEKLGTDG